MGQKSGKANFMMDLYTCFTSCCGDFTCAKSCTMKRRGYSDSCATCFGNFSACTIKYCQHNCIGGVASECVTCFETNCKEPFAACSGISDAPWTPDAFVVAV